MAELAQFRLVQTWESQQALQAQLALSTQSVGSISSKTAFLALQECYYQTDNKILPLLDCRPPPVTAIQQRQ